MEFYLYIYVSSYNNYTKKNEYFYLARNDSTGLSFRSLQCTSLIWYAENCYGSIEVIYFVVVKHIIQHITYRVYAVPLSNVMLDWRLQNLLLWRNWVLILPSFWKFGVICNYRLKVNQYAYMYKWHIYILLCHEHRHAPVCVEDHKTLWIMNCIHISHNLFEFVHTLCKLTKRTKKA